MFHQAILCKDNKGYDSLAYERVPTPTPKENQVLVNVTAAGLNYPDVLMTFGKYQFQPRYPFSPGAEMCGYISEIGPKVTKFQIGDRIIGFPGLGAFQEKLVISEDRCIKLPNELPLTIAAGFVGTYGTALHAVQDRGQIKPGEVCLILGASGGVGIAAIEVCKALGGIVIAAASSQEKLQLCKDVGADYLIDYSNQNMKSRIMEITKNAGVSIVVDAVGGNHSNTAIRSMAWRGRYLVIGFVGGIPKIPLNLPLLKGSSIVGVFWASFAQREPRKFEADVQQLFELFIAGKLKPKPNTQFSLSETSKAMALMEKRQIMGKAILLCDRSKF